MFGVVLLLTCLLCLTPYSDASGDDWKAALIIIDVQDCFISGGSLAVNGGDDVIPVVNKIRDQYKDKFSLVVLSQDWHPLGHVSFASSHPGVQSPMSLKYTPQGKLCTSADITRVKFPNAIDCQNVTKTETLMQVLWPDHCIQNVNTGPTSSAFADTLEVKGEDLIIQKGTHREIDSYSAFFDNGGFGKTKLDDELRRRGITHVFVTGLAADFCVYFTSLDAQKLGYETYYVMDATKPVSQDSYQLALQELSKKGVNLITTDLLPQIFHEISQNNSPHIVASPSLLVMASVAMVIRGLF